MGNRIARILLLGGFSEKEKNIEVRGEIKVRDLLKKLAAEVGDAFYSDGSPRPGILVFINGVDSRLFSGEENVGGEIEVKIVKVYHGG